MTKTSEGNNACVEFMFWIFVCFLERRFFFRC